LKETRNPTVTFLVLMLTLTILTSLTTFLPATAQSNTEIKVLNPLTGLSSFNFYTNETLSGKRFNLTVYLYNVSELFAYQVSLKINDTLLNITRAWVPTWDPDWVFTGQTTVGVAPAYYDDDGDNVIERVKVGECILGEGEFEGSGLLAIIELAIILDPNLGETLKDTLNIDNDDTYLLDEAMQRISCIKYDGEYTYTLGQPPKPWLEISPITTTFGPFPPSAVGKTFTIEVYIKNLEEKLDLANITFSLTFNNTLITTSNITTNNLWQQTTIDNTTQGKIRITLTSPSSTPKGNISLSTIKFRINHQPKYPEKAESPLTLQEITLKNPLGQISTEPPINGKVIIEGLLDTPWLEVIPNIVEFGPEPFLGKHFSVEVWIRGLNSRWELTRISLSVTYNSTLIQVLNVTEGNFLPSFYKTHFETAIEESYIKIRESPAEEVQKFPEGEGPIAKLSFNITRREQALINSPLNLVNTTLLDKNDNQIPVNFVKMKNGYCQLNGLMEPSNLTINLSSELIEKGSNVSISGTLTPTKIGAEITIYYKLEESATWNTLDSVTTDELSQYEYIWSINQTGIYQVKAKWLGDETTLPAESEIRTLVVKAPEEPSQPAFPYLLVAAGIAGAVIVIALILYALKRRKQT